MNEKKDGNNVVLFPNLHHRLVMKGTEALENKQYKQAAELFSQARELDQEHAEGNVGLLVSLVELQDYKAAKQLCKELLHQGIGDYFQITNMYLMVLVQLGEHEDIVEMIELLFQEHQIPFDKMEQFEQMLSFSKRTLEEREIEAEQNESQLQQQLQEEPLFNGKNEQQLLNTINMLSQMNVRPFIDDIQQFMQEEANHPFFKTMLLNILKEQDYTQTVEVRKFSQVSSLIPAHLPNLKEYPFFKKVWDLAEQKLAQRNPSLLEMVHSLLERHCFLLYPFELEQDGATIAAAYHALAEQYMTGQDFCERAALIYETEEQVVRECLDYIKEIEGISYPII
ncbi:tetratricopeptide repeat protein [Peribacillus sp. Hz7]|uniref:tetratricopeptide repeat protein n=1 Tax=Peribacillus sp. Hz7 TaxID=3344873 RepID=UPI0035CB7214